MRSTLRPVRALVLRGHFVGAAVHLLAPPPKKHAFTVSGCVETKGGGIDADYSTFFGSRVQRAVYDAVARPPEAKIPAGAAEWIATGHARIPDLVVAPTMEVPEQVPPSNSYRALRAALRLLATRVEPIDSVYCPGLATGVGCVPPEDAAREMAAAYRDSMAERVARKSEENE